MADLYAEYDVLIFPSLLETWGLPISEAKKFGLPILVADLPYSRETVGSYNRAKFFDPSDVISLSNLVLSLHLREEDFDEVVMNDVAQPFASDWKNLFEILLLKDVN